MTRFIFITLCLFIVVQLILPLDGISQGRWSKEWEEKFEKSQPSPKIMDAIGIKQGMTVAEIGAGNGRLAVRLAERVGEQGKVYANDIDPEALEFMRKRCKDEGIKNMIVVEGKATDPRLPKGMMDVVILANTLHMVEKPLPLLKNIVPSLKSDGILAILDFDQEKLKKQGWEAKSNVVSHKDEIITLLNNAGFELVQEHKFLTYSFILLLRVKGIEGN